MGDSTIHDLPAAASVSGTDVLPLDQGLVTVKATVAQVGATIGSLNLGPAIHASPTKTTPVDADEFGISDSADSNKLKSLTWANLKTTFSAEGNALTATRLQTARTIDGTSFDGSANITVVAPAIHAAPSKATPVDADELGIWDSVSGLLNKLTWANLKTTLAGTFPTLATLAASGGSALVGFLQAGTGAVLRTLQAKNRDIVSVKDFGAVGDGATDDTAAIQAAIDHILTVGGKLVFPTGDYVISSTLQVYSLSASLGVRITGEGGGYLGSRILWKGNAPSGYVMHLRG